MYVQISTMIILVISVSLSVLLYFFFKNFFKMKKACTRNELDIEDLSERLDEIYKYYYDLDDSIDDLKREFYNKKSTKSDGILSLDFVDSETDKPKRGRPSKK